MPWFVHCLLFAARLWSLVTHNTCRRAFKLFNHFVIQVLAADLEDCRIFAFFLTSLVAFLPGIWNFTNRRLVRVMGLVSTTEGARIQVFVPCCFVGGMHISLPNIEKICWEVVLYLKEREADKQPTNDNGERSAALAYSLIFLFDKLSVFTKESICWIFFLTPPHPCFEGKFWCCSRLWETQYSELLRFVGSWRSLWSYLRRHKWQKSLQDTRKWIWNPSQVGL